MSNMPSVPKRLEIESNVSTPTKYLEYINQNSILIFYRVKEKTLYDHVSGRVYKPGEIITYIKSDKIREAIEESTLSLLKFGIDKKMDF